MLRLARFLLLCISHPKATFSALAALAVGLLAWVIPPWLVCEGPPSVDPAESGSLSDPLGSVEILGYGAMEVVADSESVYWTQVGVHEYDDEPAYITRAAVRRQSHSGGDVELIFDFQRDGARCTPRSPGFVRKAISWLCYQEWVDGPFDPTKYMLLWEGSLRNTPFGGTHGAGVTTDGETVFAATSGDRLLRMNPLTGEFAPASTFPDEFNLIKVAGADDGVVWGTASGDTDDLVWRAPADGSTPEVVLRRPSAWFDVVVGDGWAAVRSGDGQHRTLSIIEDGGERVLYRGEKPMAHLTAFENRIYFVSMRNIYRIDIAGGDMEFIAPGDPAGPLAIGGGFVYWVDGRSLCRTQLP